MLLAAAFVSYAAPFNMPLRESLVREQWLPDIASRCIPLSEGIAPLDMLTDDATKVGRGSRDFEGTACVRGGGSLCWECFVCM